MHDAASRLAVNEHACAKARPFPLTSSALSFVVAPESCCCFFSPSHSQAGFGAVSLFRVSDSARKNRGGTMTFPDTGPGKSPMGEVLQVWPRQRNDEAPGQSLECSVRRSVASTSKYAPPTSSRRQRNRSWLSGQRDITGRSFTEPSPGPLLPVRCFPASPPSSSFQRLNSHGQTHHYNEIRPTGPRKKASTSWLKPGCHPAAPRAGNVVLEKSSDAPQSSMTSLHESQRRFESRITSRNTSGPDPSGRFKTKRRPPR